MTSGTEKPHTYDKFVWTDASQLREVKIVTKASPQSHAQPLDPEKKAKSTGGVGASEKSKDGGSKF